MPLQAIALWKANPHEWGPGKIHLIEPDSQPPKLVCGRLIKNVPGELMVRADGAEPTCQACIQQVEKRREREAREAAWEKEREQRERERLREQAEWRARYDEYMQTPEWARKRDLVLRRAHGICEGCGWRRAVQAHHTTYAHVFDEFLWELRAVCRACHDRYHAGGVL